MTQAIQRWAGGVVVRQDDDIIVFRGRRALLPFCAAGYTQEMTFQFTVNYDNNFNISKTHRISCNVQPFNAYKYKADVSFSYAPLRIKSGAFSHVQCTAGGSYHHKCLGSLGGGEEQVGTVPSIHHQAQPLPPDGIPLHPPALGSCSLFISA